jgi:hypothetical protein
MAIQPLRRTALRTPALNQGSRVDKVSPYGMTGTTLSGGRRILPERGGRQHVRGSCPFVWGTEKKSARTITAH